jgi:hypothetical protein
MSNQLMTLEQIKTALQDKKLYFIANKLKLSYPTLKKLADGKVKNCNYITIQKLSDYLRKPEFKV